MGTSGVVGAGYCMKMWSDVCVVAEYSVVVGAEDMIGGDEAVYVVRVMQGGVFCVS